MSRSVIEIVPDKLSLPLDIITMRQAEYGDSGAGKTAYARLLAEKVHGVRHRFCAIDLKNDWWGLKASADGKSEGIPIVIFGGPRRDIQLVEGGAAAVAEAVASIEQSVIIDLDNLSRRKQEQFLATFLDRLYETNRRPLLLFCDEADRYAPQKPMTEDSILSLSSSEDIARRGRKRGIGSCWLTQRTAVLNKNVSEFANMTVVFRTPGSKDLRELEERVGRIADKQTVNEVLRLAPGLADGEAFFLSSHPKLRPFMPNPVRPIQLPMPWTFDSSATPGVGKRRREPKVLAKTDLKLIESKMAEQIEKAKSEDPKQLRAQLVEAVRATGKWKAIAEAKVEPSASKPQKVQVHRIKVPAMPIKQVRRLERFQKSLTDGMAKIQGQFDDCNKVIALCQSTARGTTEMIEALLIDIAKRTDGQPTGGSYEIVHPIVKYQPGQQKAAEAQLKQMTSAKGNGDRGPREVTLPPPRISTGPGVPLPIMWKKMLTNLAREGRLTKQRLLVLAGYTSSGPVSKAFTNMTREGYVTAPKPTMLEITPAGLKALGPFEPKTTGDQLRADMLGEQSKLSTMEKKIMGYLFAQYPDTPAKKIILEQCNYTSSGPVSKCFTKIVRAGWARKGEGSTELGASHNFFDDAERAALGVVM